MLTVDVAKWYLIFNAQTDLSDYSRYLLLICNKSVCYLDRRLTVQNVDQNIMYKFTNFIKYQCSRIYMWGKKDKKVLNMSKKALFTPFFIFQAISETVRFYFLLFFLHSYLRFRETEAICFFDGNFYQTFTHEFCCFFPKEMLNIDNQ